MSNFNYQHSVVKVQEQERWVAVHPECDEPTSEDTDAEIVHALGRTLGESLSYYDGELGEYIALDSEGEFRVAVRVGMDAWWNKRRLDNGS